MLNLIEERLQHIFFAQPVDRRPTLHWLLVLHDATSSDCDSPGEGTKGSSCDVSSANSMNRRRTWRAPSAGRRLA